MSEADAKIARLEARTDEQERRLASIEAKLDKLLELAAIGKGSIWLLLKIAGVLAGLGAAFAWCWDKIN